MGLFSLLSVGTRGLSAAQIGMDLSGQNISNADVDGYSRKRMNSTADYRKDPTFGQMGFGVNVINIVRMRSSYIDSQIGRQNQQVGVYQEIEYTLTSLENSMTEPSDTGILHYTDQFFNSWQNLANNPSDLAARTLVKSSAEMLTEAFHNLSGEMSALRQTRNDELTMRVDKVNKLAQEIYNLNMEIGAVEIGNQNANDSRDSRDKKVKELANLIDIDTIENSQGQITVTTGGSIIVSPTYVNPIETTTVPIQLPDGTSFSNIGLRFSRSKQIYTPMGGQVKGLIDSRDVVIPEFQNYLDSLARTIVSKVNELHERGFNLNGYSGIEFFDPTVTGASDIDISASIAASVQNIAAASGGAPVGGTDTILAPALNFGAVPAALTNKNIMQNTVTVTTAGGVVLRENIDYHIDYINGTLQMLHAAYDNVDMTIDYQYGSGNFKGPGDNSNAIALAQLRQALTMDQDTLGNPTSSFTEYYSAFVGRLGSAKNEATSNLETRTFLIKQYESHQDSIAGVSLDEEMADLVKFQHIYEASARLISITSEMLDILLKI